ncbi:hypothetical protein NIES2098_29940 [Calothrix sp. NIES-2098]|nr:hypothetical protein NIES2098_29940 [Calothrix sp. NIES-2098]
MSLAIAFSQYWNAEILLGSSIFTTNIIELNQFAQFFLVETTA